MPGHLRDVDRTEETGIVPVGIQVGKRAYKACLPVDYRSALTKRAYRGFTVARLKTAPTGDLRARLETAPTRCIETREVSPTGDLRWAWF